MLQDENRDKEAPAKFTGPPGPAAAARTPRQSTGTQLDAAADEAAVLAAAAAAALEAGARSSEQPQRDREARSASVSSAGAVANGAAAAAGVAPGGSSSRGTLQSHPPSAVQWQVDALNRKLEEAAATAHSDGGSGTSGGGSAAHAATAGEVVMRHGASFRVVRTLPPGVAATAAAAMDSTVVEEALQPVHVVKDVYASKIKVCVVERLALSLGPYPAAAAATLWPNVFRVVLRPTCLLYTPVTGCHGLTGPVEGCLQGRCVCAWGWRLRA